MGERPWAIYEVTWLGFNIITGRSLHVIYFKKLWGFSFIFITSDYILSIFFWNFSSSSFFSSNCFSWILRLLVRNGMFSRNKWSSNLVMKFYRVIDIMYMYFLKTFDKSLTHFGDANWQWSDLPFNIIKCVPHGRTPVGHKRSNLVKSKC